MKSFSLVVLYSVLVVVFGRRWINNDDVHQENNEKMFLSLEDGLTKKNFDIDNQEKFFLSVGDKKKAATQTDDDHQENSEKLFLSLEDGLTKKDIDTQKKFFLNVGDKKKEVTQGETDQKFFGLDAGVNILGLEVGADAGFHK